MNVREQLATIVAKRRTLRSVWFRARYHVLRRVLPIVLPVQARDDLVRLGSSYGGWIIPSDLLEQGALCYCAGLGEDGSFDRELATQFRCQVHVFDPTPRAMQYAESNLSDLDLITFHPIGLWSERKVIRLYAPRDPSHVSHSALNLQRTAEFIEAECVSVSDFVRDSGHATPRLLKLDIEGAEYAVLSGLIRDNIYPEILCVEFDQPVFLLTTLRQIRALLAHGYMLVSIDAWNYTFVRSR